MAAELFDKIYGRYYYVVRRMLEAGARAPLTRRDMDDVCGAYSYRESALTIVPKLTGGGWALFEQREDKTYAPVLHHPDRLKPPLTGLQKSWLKSLLADPRARLFFTDSQLAEVEEALGDTEALYDPEDFHYFDRYLDGDDYTSELYRKNFQAVLEALEQNRTLKILYQGPKNGRSSFEAVPCQLQYSSKDDKFRLVCLRRSHGRFSRSILLNMARIQVCVPGSGAVPPEAAALRFSNSCKAAEPVRLKISGERNSLERCMLHFANYEKHTEYDEEEKAWICSIYYDMADETELLIEVLSFGPVVWVLGPESFLRQIRARVKRQHQLFYEVTE